MGKGASKKSDVEDRSWMYNRLYPKRSGLKPVFVAGLDKFIKKAMRHEIYRIEGGIRCPCVKCELAACLTPDEVKVHLEKEGFQPNYFIWTAHGEAERNICVRISPKACMIGGPQCNNFCGVKQTQQLPQIRDLNSDATSRNRNIAVEVCTAEPKEREEYGKGCPISMPQLHGALHSQRMEYEAPNDSSSSTPVDELHLKNDVLINTTSGVNKKRQLLGANVLPKSFKKVSRGSSCQSRTEHSYVQDEVVSELATKLDKSKQVQVQQQQMSPLQGIKKSKDDTWQRSTQLVEEGRHETVISQTPRPIPAPYMHGGQPSSETQYPIGSQFYCSPPHVGFHWIDQPCGGGRWIWYGPQRGEFPHYGPTNALHAPEAQYYMPPSQTPYYPCLHHPNPQPTYHPITPTYMATLNEGIQDGPFLQVHEDGSAVQQVRQRGTEVEIHELHTALHPRKGTEQFVDEWSAAAYGRYKELFTELQKNAEDFDRELTPLELKEAKKRCWKEAVGDFNKDRLCGTGPISRQFKPVHVESASRGLSTQHADVPPPWAQELLSKFRDFSKIQQRTQVLLTTLVQSLLRPPFPQQPHYQYPPHPWHQAPQTPYHPSYQREGHIPPFYPPYPQVQYPFMGSGPNFGSSPGGNLGNSPCTPASGSGSQTFPEHPVTTPEGDAAAKMPGHQLDPKVGSSL